MIRSVWWFAFFLCFNSVFSQTQLRFRNYSTRDGLSHNEISYLYSDSRGFLWIGTEFGLNRFDGVSFEKWFHVPGDSTSLANNNVHCITEDSLEQLWVATEKGISIYDFHHGKFHSFREVPTQNGGNIPLDQPVDFCDQDGDIWIGSGSGSVIFYNSSNHLFYNIPILLAPKGRMQNKFIVSFLQDNKNRLWVSTSYGIYLLNKTNLTATPYRIDETNPYGQVLNACTALFETQHGQLLCGTWNGGFLIFDEKNNRFNPFYGLIGPFLPCESVFNFGQHEETILLSTGNGLFSCRESDLRSDGLKSFSLIEPDQQDPFGLPSNYIHILLTDRKGNLWLGGENGLSLVNANSRDYQEFSYKELSPFGNEAPRSIDQNGNQLLVGISKEVMLFDLKEEKFLLEKPRLDPIGFHKFIKSGNHLYQPSQTGLAIYDLKFNHLSTIRDPYANGLYLNIYNALEDSQGNFWTVTSRFGLRKHEHDGHIIPFLHDSTQAVHSIGHLIGDIIESPHGDIYAGGKQLFILKKNETSFTAVSILNEKASNEIRALSMQDSILWIGSRNGLYSYHERTGAIIQHHLPADVNQVITDLEIDLSGNLWMITATGIVIYDPVDSTTMILNERNGWPSFFSCIRALSNGKVAAGSNGKIIIIDPQVLRPDMDNPKPYITRVVIDEKSYFLPGADTTFELKYNQRISFHFTSLNYQTASSIKYTWQLKGLDDRWQNTGNITNQPFASLAPGDYTFNVKSINANNTWSEMSSVHFHVMPPFYRTAWFIMGSLLLVMSMIYWFYRYRLQKAIQIERMRTRIATDLHDDIGATLSSISFYSEAVRQRTKNNLPEVSSILEKMGDTSRKMVSSMSDIVWAINPENDDMDKMLQRMLNHAKELSGLREETIQMNIDNKARHLKLELEQRRNIFLIYKEAVTNALKYADCRLIQVDVTVHGNVLHLTVTDDGKGFDVGEEREGNGLKNMQRRAAEIDGDIRIHSEKNKGTTIELIVAL
jgi:ligand-binding sensor domain-containing protein/two-component sensor histidine kinase